MCAKSCLAAEYLKEEASDGIRKFSNKQLNEGSYTSHVQKAVDIRELQNEYFLAPVPSRSRKKNFFWSRSRPGPVKIFFGPGPGPVKTFLSL